MYTYSCIAMEVRNVTVDVAAGKIERAIDATQFPHTN